MDATSNMRAANNLYEPVIGLEVHVELATESKMFCGCPADHFGREPNTITCPVCLGLPGALPVPNKKAVEWTILLGLTLGCTINEESKFDRKHYFYPDLPKGYQISQYDQPLAINGSLELSNYPIIQLSNKLIKSEIRNPKPETNSKFQIPNSKRIRIQRVHLEEDTGKLIHATVDGNPVTLVDFNRSGVPLVEIVTEPDFRSVDDVDGFLKYLQRIVRYLGISTADMEKGSMRIEPSVSIRKSQIPNPNVQQGSSRLTDVRSNDKTYSSSEVEKLPSYRVEIKNINSFRFARKAIEYEIARQTELFERGATPTQETRGWSETKGITVGQRRKEEAHDYRYFPEPDIPPMRWTQYQISNIKYQIGEMPDAKKERFMKDYHLNNYDATILVENRERADYFESCIAESTRQPINASLSPKTIANWIINKRVDVDSLLPAQLLDQIFQSMQAASVSDEELEKIVKHTLAENPKAVADYKKGKKQAFMFLVGQVMRDMKGRADPETVRKFLKNSLY